MAVRQRRYAICPTVCFRPDVRRGPNDLHCVLGPGVCLAAPGHILGTRASDFLLAEHWTCGRTCLLSCFPSKTSDFSELNPARLASSAHICLAARPSSNSFFDPNVHLRLLGGCDWFVVQRGQGLCRGVTARNHLLDACCILTRSTHGVWDVALGGSSGGSFVLLPALPARFACVLESEVLHRCHQRLHVLRNSMVHHLLRSEGLDVFFWCRLALLEKPLAA